MTPATSPEGLSTPSVCRIYPVPERSGDDVVAAVLLFFPDWQKWNRENVEDYFGAFGCRSGGFLRRETKTSTTLLAARCRMWLASTSFPEPFMTDLQIDNNADRDDMSEFVLKILDHPRLLAC